MTNILADDLLSTSPDPPSAISIRRLWLQVVGSAVAWVGLGVADVLISWRSCVHQEQYGGPSFHPAARLLFFAMSGLLLGLALLTGLTSYRSWRKLSRARDLIQAEGREHKEFMSLAGFFISLTLGFGIVWLSLPLFILQMCARAR